MNEAVDHPIGPSRRRGFPSTLILGLLTLLAACGSEPYKNATLIDGEWVGEPTACAATDDLCARVAECAATNLWPAGAPPIDRARLFDPPTQMKDGTLIKYGMGGWIVTFELPGGSIRATKLIGTDPCLSTTRS